MWLRVDRYAWAFAAVAAVMIVAGGLVAAINSSAPIAHGPNLGNALVVHPRFDAVPMLRGRARKLFYTLN